MIKCLFARIAFRFPYYCRIIYFIIDEDNSLRDELEGQEKDSSQFLEFKYIYGLDEV